MKKLREVLSPGLLLTQENTSKIHNLPGNPMAVREGREIIMNIIPHAVEKI